MHVYIYNSKSINNYNNKKNNNNNNNNNNYNFITVWKALAEGKSPLY